jgi:Rieske Fe-S protein
MSDALISRRSILRGALVTVGAGVVGYVVAAHSSAAKAASPGTNAYGSPATSGGKLLAELRDIPPGGGVVVSSAQVVISRTPAGAVHAFSSICTHQGCTVNAPHGGVIQCPCHGSEFNAETGAVIQGPATTPLPARPVAVSNGGVYSA